MTTDSPLFRPLTIRGMTLPNRIVRSATAERRANADGVPDPGVGELYRELATGGVGLIITGHAYVHPRGCCHREMTSAADDALIAPLAHLATAAHEGGARIALQINHGGCVCDPAVAGEPVGPSAVIDPRTGALAHALTALELRSIATAFAEAARRARAAGFDAVQIHGAHGYLISQFLSPLTNRRRDAYGGSLENRARFLQEVARQVRLAVGEDYPVLIKLGVSDNEEGGLTAGEGARVAGWLEHWGVDAIETSTGRRGAVRTRITRPEREAYLLELAHAVRAETRLPILLVGGLRSRPVMERVLGEGIDLVSLSRPFLCEPGLARRLATDPEACAACVSCNRCWPETAGEGTGCHRKDRPRRGKPPAGTARGSA